MFWKTVKQRAMIVALLFLLPLINGCSETKEMPSEEPASNQEKFFLGLLPEHDLFTQVQRYDPFVGYVSKRAGVDVELRVLSRYGNLINNFADRQLDAAFLGSLSGALAIEKIGVEPLVRPEWVDGSSTYHGLIFIRKDSGINSVAAMKGKRFVFVDKATTAGWLLPLHFFKQLGMDDFRTWFAETYFSGTHEDAIYDVLDGKADIGAAKNTVFNRLAEKDGRLLKDLQILATSPDVPSSTMAVRKGLDPSLKKRLVTIFLQMDQNEEGREILRNFGATRFIVTTEKDYEPVFTYAGEIGRDLAKYNYFKE
jgi:phosphonate transport system substrate-binding protein